VTGKGGFGRSSRERSAHAAFFYPGTTVLKNKLDLQDQVALDDAEALLFAVRLLFLKVRPIPDYETFKEIHRVLFGDVYAWAGQTRSYTTGRGAAPFAAPEFIEPEMARRFELIAKDTRLTATEPGVFATAAAEHAAEINAIHPFLEGNGRMTRLFIQGYALAAGYDFSSAHIGRDAWYAAAEVSFMKADYGPLAQLILANLTALDNP
jgi:fido (protein-threonine AMPylation protein)